MQEADGLRYSTMSESLSKPPEEGDKLSLGYRVVGNVNQAEIAYWVKEVPVFVHEFDDDHALHDDPQLMVDQEYLDEADEADAAHCRAYIEGLPPDPDHERIEFLVPRD